MSSPATCLNSALQALPERTTGFAIVTAAHISHPAAVEPRPCRRLFFEAAFAKLAAGRLLMDHSGCWNRELRPCRSTAQMNAEAPDGPLLIEIRAESTDWPTADMLPKCRVSYPWHPGADVRLVCRNVLREQVLPSLGPETWRDLPIPIRTGGAQARRSGNFSCLEAKKSVLRFFGILRRM